MPAPSSAGVKGDGVYLKGGTLTNQNGGTIEGVYNGVVTAGGTVTNGGLITGTGTLADGIAMAGGGLLINAANGTIAANRRAGLRGSPAQGEVRLGDLELRRRSI
jgi:hypothetical protein